ncbi:MAG TPA: LamG domain-containing protein, partial [Parafilimonas sp.]|nr:LamG domain-containing protein [Parafilimonas sp.]
MKKNTINLLIFAALAFSFQCMSCKKDQAINQNAIRTSSSDNIGIHGLPVDSSLVAWYTFTKGRLNDKSFYHNKIIFCSASPTVSRNGEDSGAYYFDGSSSYMSVKNNASLNPVGAISLAALVKPMGFYQGTCHSNRILNKEYNDVSNGRYVLGFDDQASYNYTGCFKPVKENREDFYSTYGNSGASASGVTDTDYIRLGKWYTVVYTYSNSVSNLYINNKLAISDTISTSFTPNGYDLLIGKSLDPSYPYYFNGVIDEIRIYNRALSSDEVLGLS